MSNPWIRLHRSALHSPKIVCLNAHLFRIWANSLLIADDNGILPSLRDFACHQRMTVQDAEEALLDLVEYRLVDIENPGTDSRRFLIHDWSAHQFRSDNSTERSQKSRKNKRNVAATLLQRRRSAGATPSDTESESESDSKLLPSEQVAARDARSDELCFDSCFGKGKVEGKGDDRQTESLVKRADGLGLDVADLIETVNRNKPKNRPAYFTSLCVNKLTGRLPGLDEKIIRDALWGDDACYGTICQILIAAEAA